MSDRLLKESDVVREVESLLIVDETRHLNDLEYGNNQALCHVIDRIEDLPSADRPQGEWIDAEIPLESGDTMPIQVCNLCKTFYPLAYTGGGHRFCPNCGARMKGESTDIDCFDTCKHAYSEVCDECYKGNKYDAVQTDCEDTSCPYFKNPDYSRCMECKSHTERSKDE